MNDWTQRMKVCILLWYENYMECMDMKDDIKKEIQLLALDVDGTLFTKDGKITSASIEAIKRAQEKGVHVVLASGRDYNGLPWKQLEDVPIEYVITTNGSAVYRCV